MALAPNDTLRPRRPLFWLAALLLTGGAGFAQDDPGDPPGDPVEPPVPADQVKLPRRNRDRGRLVLPESPPAQEEQQPPEPVEKPIPAPKSDYWAGDLDRYEKVFATFETLPNPTEVEFREALSNLQGLGLATRPAALKALRSPHPPTVQLAAHLLQSVGLPEDADELVVVASSVGVQNVASDCLEAALRLNGGWLPLQAVRMLEHPRKSVRSSVEARLGRFVHDDHLTPLLQHVRYGRDPDVRMRAARLLGPLRGQPDARQALLDALEDPAMTVNLSAAQMLAGDASPADFQLVRQEILAAEPGPVLGYLCYALLLQLQTDGKLLLDEELEQHLVGLLEERDPFLGGAVAACLAEFGYRSNRDEGFDYLDLQVPRALVRAVGGMAYYPQYSRLLPLAEASLERISGRDFSESQPQAWVEWLMALPDDFRAVRGSLHLGPGDYPLVQLGWRIEDKPWRWLGGAGCTSPAPELRLLGQSGLETLAAALEKARLLQLSRVPAAFGLEQKPVIAELEIQVGQRRKRLAYRGDSLRDWMVELDAVLEELYGATSWQLLAPADDRRDFVLAVLERWDAADPAERLEMMVDLTRGRLSTLKDEDLVAWSESLIAREELLPLWPDDLAREFLAEVQRRGARLDVARAALGAALLAPGPELAEPFFEAVVAVSEPNRSELLFTGLDVLGMDVCVAALEDSRLAVRVAAARALARCGREATVPLVMALQDPSALVVQKAVASLGHLADPAALSELLALAGRGNPREIRKEALWALGEIGDPNSLEVVRLAAADEDASVRLVAILALGQIPGPEADALFDTFFPDFAATPLEAPFLRALDSRGAASTRRILRSHVDALDVEVASRAALHLGYLGDPDAAPFLISMITAAPRDANVLDALAFATCADFRQMPDPAGMYVEWWRERGRMEPETWLAAALENLGRPVPSDLTTPAASMTTEERRRTVAGLLELMETGPTYLRPAVTFHLNRLTGVDAPAVRARTSDAVARTTVEPWVEWLDGRSQG